MTDSLPVPRPSKKTKAARAEDAAASNESAKAQMANAIFDLVLHVPASTESTLQNPVARAHQVSRAAARNASLISGSMALPPGFLGWLTVLPELYGVWKLQAQMVSDIASIYGKQSTLGREQMLYCLFKHVSAQLFRDVVVRVGQRVVVREASAQSAASHRPAGGREGVAGGAGQKPVALCAADWRRGRGCLCVLRYAPGGQKCGRVV